MTTFVVAIFCLVYLGMILGGLPFVQLDRAGVALLGAIALLTVGDVTLAQAANAIIANLIVADAATRRGVHLDWRGHARVGVPVTLATFGVAALYLWLPLPTA